MSEAQPPWHEELIMQFYATILIHPGSGIKWITDGVLYESLTKERAEIPSRPPKDENLFIKRGKHTCSTLTCLARLLWCPKLQNT